MKDESCEGGWWTEGKASEQLLIGARRVVGRLRKGSGLWHL